MKNTVKKILALVFAVVMVCSLAVPALAAEEETVSAGVTVITYDGAVMTAGVAVKASKANVEEAIDAFNEVKNLDAKFIVDVVGTTGLVKEVGGLEADEVDETNVFNTGYWAVALNGKLVSEDLGTVAIEEDDRVVVYWNDPTFGTKLAQVDDSQLNKGVLTFFYYDAEGNKQPLKGAYISLRETKSFVLRDKLNVVNEEFLKDNDTTNDEDAYEFHFVTDEDGEIWISPEYLDHKATYTIDFAAYNKKPGTTTYAETIIDPLKKVDDKDGYTKTQVAYYNENLDRNMEDGAVIGYVINVDSDLYNTADATGDMTMVYVLVAAVAVITLAAVVVMKKKAVKAN